MGVGGSKPNTLTQPAVHTDQDSAVASMLKMLQIAAGGQVPVCCWIPECQSAPLLCGPSQGACTTRSPMLACMTGGMCKPG